MEKMEIVQVMDTVYIFCLGHELKIYMWLVYFSKFCKMINTFVLHDKPSAAALMLETKDGTAVL